MTTDTRRQEFMAAFHALRAARLEYDATMDRIMAGELFDQAELMLQVKELDRLHSDWMAKSTPFVHWR